MSKEKKPCFVCERLRPDVHIGRFTRDASRRYGSRVKFNVMEHVWYCRDGYICTNIIKRFTVPTIIKMKASGRIDPEKIQIQYKIKKPKRARRRRAQ